MLKVTALQLTSLDVDYHELSWQIGDTQEDVFDTLVVVEQSESVAGPWEAISEPFSDRYRFIDRTVTAGHKWRTLYYRLRLLHVPTGRVDHTPPATLEPPADLYAQAIRQDTQLLYREFAGRPCWLLPVRTFGQRCVCWSPSLRTRTTSNCRTCFDTSFARGYLQPIEVPVQIDPSPKATVENSSGALQVVNTTARMGYYPAVKPFDVLVESENRRWRVTSVSQTEKHRARIRQELQLHEIPPTDAEYLIPLQLEQALKDTWRYPPRNSTLPMNDEGARTFIDLYLPSTKP